MSVGDDFTSQLVAADGDADDVDHALVRGHQFASNRADIAWRPHDVGHEASDGRRVLDGDDVERLFSGEVNP